MPPSFVYEPCRPCYLHQMASLSPCPLTLALSPGRGDRFVDTGNKFEVRALRA